MMFLFNHFYSALWIEIQIKACHFAHYFKTLLTQNCSATSRTLRGQEIIKFELLKTRKWIIKASTDLFCKTLYLDWHLSPPLVLLNYLCSFLRAVGISPWPQRFAVLLFSGRYLYLGWGNTNVDLGEHKVGENTAPSPVSSGTHPGKKERFKG